MAHELDRRADGEAAMVYSNYQKPWHGLGESVEGLMTSQECLKKSGQDFKVEKQPVYRKKKDGKFVEIEDSFETWRTDRDANLGVVGSVYEPYQNENAFEFFDSIVKDGEAIYDTAGSLFGGKKVWLLAKLPSYTIVSGDQLEKYLFFFHSHDGSLPLTVQFTHVRVVCWNTAKAALKGVQTSIRVRHTKNAAEKLIQAKKTIGIASVYYDKIGAVFGDMVKIDVNKAVISRYLKNLVPDPLPIITEDGKKQKRNNARAANVRNQIQEIFEVSPAINEIKASKGTLWGLYNAATEYVQHHKVVPYADKREGQRFFVTNIAADSGAHEFRQSAFNEALKLLRSNPHFIVNYKN
jgi:phage/plasmid-like protein (TIGR03299 family)